MLVVGQESLSVTPRNLRKKWNVPIENKKKQGGKTWINSQDQDKQEKYFFR